MQYTVTDKGHYEEITLPEWGETHGLDAAHIMYGDTIGAVVLEPASRSDFGEDDEFDFRSNIQALVDGFEDQPDSIIFDPGRDRQSSIKR